MVWTVRRIRKVGVAGIMEIQKAEPRDKEHSHTYFGTVHTYNFFANRLLILIQKVIPEKQMAFFIWRMSVPSFIQDYTHDGTREFMDILKETIIQIL